MGGTRVYIGGLPYGVREKDLERFFKGYGRIRDILIKNGYGFVEFDDHRDADDAVYELNGKDLLGERSGNQSESGQDDDQRQKSKNKSNRVVVELAHASARGRSGGPSSRGFRDRRTPAAGGSYARSGGDRGGGDGDRDNRRKTVIVERARGVPRDGRGRSSRRGPPRGSDKYGPPTRTEYRLIVENLSSRVSWQDLKDYMRQAGEVTYADAHKQRRNEGVVEFASYSDLKAALEKLDDTELNGRRVRLVEDRGRGGRSGGGGRRSRSSSRGSRSKSRSRSRSRGRRDSRSRSRSKSKSKSPRSKSRSKSRSRSRSRSKGSRDSRDKSKSRSPVKTKKESKSKSRSRSNSRSRSKSRDKSRSRSVSKGRDSRSRSKSVEKNGERSPSRGRDDKDDHGDD